MYFIYRRDRDGGRDGDGDWDGEGNWGGGNRIGQVREDCKVRQGNVT